MITVFTPAPNSAIPTHPVAHNSADTFEVDDAGVLFVYAGRECVAVYAHHCWERATTDPQPDQDHKSQLAPGVS